jgi:hypothetical protein
MESSWQTSERHVAIALRLMVLALVFLQRFAVPVVGTALVLPIVLAILAWLAVDGALVFDSRRTALYLLAIGGCLTSTILATAIFRDQWSLKSLALLVLLYVPFCFRLRVRLRHLYRPLLEFFNWVMVVAAVAALGQWLAQLAGWTYSDLLGFVPKGFLLGTYNTSYPITYGSSLWKSNGVVFLEPSFCSQFLAIALVGQLILGGKRWRLALYSAALLTTVTGTGIILVMVGLVVLAVRRGPAWTAKMTLVLVLVGAAISVTPLGAIVAQRSSEPGTRNSSGNARFVAPYLLVQAGLADDVPTMLVGRGPGVISRSTGSEVFNQQDVEANYPAIPKLAAEYGLIATAIFCAFVVTALTSGTPSPTMSAAMLLVYFVLSGSLLQPHTVYAAYLFTSLFAAPALYAARRQAVPGPESVTELVRAHLRGTR